MKKLLQRRAFTILLTLILAIHLIPLSASAAKPSPTTFYNASAAIEYADKHWNDGYGLCANFVSACLKAGGIDIPNRSYYSPNSTSYQGISGKLGAYNNPYIASAALLRYLSDAGYKVIKNPKQTDMALGDILFMKSGRYPDSHVTIITKVSNGKAYFSAHNDPYHDHPVGNLGTYLVKMNGYIDVTQQFAGKKISIQNNGRYLSCLPFQTTVTSLRRNEFMYRKELISFTIELTPDGWCGLRASSGRYLTAEKDKNGQLNCRGDQLQSWECWRIWRNSSGYLLESQATGCFLAMKGTNVQNISIRANASAVLSSTKLKIKTVY